MLDGPLVFVDVDTQRDFMEPDGSLAITDAGLIHAHLERLTRFARERGIPVIATACAHTLDEEDPEPFPPHCLVGTRGQERIEATAWAGSHVVGTQGRFPHDAPVPHLTLEKSRYDVFSHPDADRIVALYARQHPTWVVYGVATDYCVRCAVLGLLARGQRVVVVVDAVRPVDSAAEPAVFTEFVERGAQLVLSDVVCGADH